MRYYKYKVYARLKGDRQKEALAMFADRTDAVNYAISHSSGKYNNPIQRITVYDMTDRRVFRTYCQGETL